MDVCLPTELQRGRVSAGREKELLREVQLSFDTGPVGGVMAMEGEGEGLLRRSE